MALPSKIKKNLPLTFPKTLIGRRQELLDKINKDGTYLPKSLLHADLDRGFLDFVKNDLRTVVEGKLVPMVDILITTQNWSQFTETWNFQNIDKNAEPPFITVVRTPEVKYGNNPSIVYTIPNRKLFFYAQVPTWDGQRKGMDIYKIPQPVPVDIEYSIKIVCNRMRELNQFNKVVIEKFSSRQAYSNIKGHYIPIIMNTISDESVMEVEKRKYYVQSYTFTLQGFLMDENEFEVSPAVSRVITVLEPDLKTKKNPKKVKVDEFSTNVFSANFSEFDVEFSYNFEYITNLILENQNNVDSFDVYINNLFFGTNLNEIQINYGDTLKIIVDKGSGIGNPSVIKFTNNLQ
jgi:hypothetical protein